MSQLPLLPFKLNKWPALCGLFVGYLALVRLLRWQRYNAIHKKYASKASNLTVQEAQNIMRLCNHYDLPGLSVYALSFALFKTYAIPTISDILGKTKQLKSKELVSRRYADTEILIATWLTCPISGRFEQDDKTDIDPRANIAIARVNFLHSRYKILNDDYLFTLALFVFEPQVWAAKYGWRPLSPLECQAHFVFWRDVGLRMGIKDIPNTMEELSKWRDEYQAKAMVPAISNRDVAVFTTEELLHAVPERFGLKNFCRRLTVCALEEPVRIAMMQEAQPAYMHAIYHSVMASVKYFQRYFCLPRLYPTGVINPEIPKSRNGEPPRMRPTRFQSKPWYKAEGTGFGKIVDQLLVALGLHNDVPGKKYKSEGYRLEEMGPLPLEQVGHDEVFKTATRLMGCPIAGPFAMGGGREKL